MTDRGSPASVRQRLLNRAKAEGVEFEYMLVRYANERLLYRLGVSDFRDRYVLKGATLFAVWSNSPHRPTRDIDLLGYGELTLERIEAEFRAICAQAVEPDGVAFDPESVDAGVIREGQAYEGVRIVLHADLDGADVRVQIDVGFGDATEPGLIEQELPTLLEFPPPRLRAYRAETVVAEKFEAMVKLGIANTRMKDFYDIFVISRTVTLDHSALAAAARATFRRRGTPLPEDTPIALTDEFANDRAKQAQWRAFATRTDSDAAALSLGEVITAIRSFLLPLLDAARREEP